MAYRPATRTVLAVGLAGVILGVGSCRAAKAPAPSAPRPVLGSLDVAAVNPGGSEHPDVDGDAVGRVARRVLQTSGLFEEARGGSGGEPSERERVPGGRDERARVVVRVKIVVGLETTEVKQKGVVRAGVQARLDSRPSDGPGTIDEVLSAGGERFYEVVPTLDRRALGQELAERTVADLLAGFVARARLRTAPESEIHAAITEQTRSGPGGGGRGRGREEETAAGPRPGTTSLREEAIRVAGLRGMKGEIPTLLPLLQDDEESVRDAALGALIALRERRAVAELTRNRSLRDRHEMRKIIEAIAILGGREARDYLSFVAESHDDEEIRTLAAEARSRLERREGP